MRSNTSLSRFIKVKRAIDAGKLIRKIFPGKGHWTCLLWLIAQYLFKC